MKNKIIQMVKPVVERFPVVATGYRKARDRSQLHKQPAMTPMGFKLVGNPIMQDGRFEPEETNLFLRYAANSDAVINVGANIGYYCLQAAKLGKHSVAFEPIPLNLVYLLRNVMANGWEHLIEIFPLALSDKSGISTMYGEGTGASVNRGWMGIGTTIQTLVPTSTLDIALSGRFRRETLFIVIDVEGHEYNVLRGAESFLKRDPKPVWMVEVAVQTTPSWPHTFQLFARYGYRSYAIIGDEVVLLTAEKVQRLVDEGLPSDASRNFVYVHESVPTPEGLIGASSGSAVPKALRF